jgi:hypothetical protein
LPLRFPLMFILIDHICYCTGVIECISSWITFYTPNNIRTQ